MTTARPSYYTIRWSDPGYVAVCNAYPNLSGLGETAQEALSTLHRAIAVFERWNDDPAAPRCAERIIIMAETPRFERPCMRPAGHAGDCNPEPMR